MTIQDAEGTNCFVPGSYAFDGSENGILTGEILAVKDLFSIEGWTSSFGHPRWRETHSPAQSTAPIIQMLLGAGGRCSGIAKMDQLAYSLIGNVGEGAPPANAFAPDCFSGGSSSGSASAVAAGLATLGVGTDTAGSIRVPAAVCGLYGLRTTHGLLDKSGVVPLARSLDVIGFLSRSPLNIIASLEAVLGVHYAGDAFDYVLLPADLPGAEDLRARYRSLDLPTLEERSVNLAELVTPEVGDLFARIQSREIWDEHSVWIAENIEHLAPDVQTRLRRCELLSLDPEHVQRADLDARQEYSARVEDLVGSGLLVMPVLPRRGPLRSWSDAELLKFRLECFRLTGPSSLSGLPQLVLPVGDSPEMAISVVGPRNSDVPLLRHVSTI